MLLQTPMARAAGGVLVSALLAPLAVSAVPMLSQEAAAPAHADARHPGIAAPGANARIGMPPTRSSSGDSVELPLDPPLGLDAYVPVPAGNPVTAAKVSLGRRLFFDTRLSADRSVSCASCHRPDAAFSDTLSLSRGVHGHRTTRNAPTLHNVAYRERFFWDGRVETLEEQVLQPVQNPREMGLALEGLERRLRVEAEYRHAFRRAFPGPTGGREGGREAEGEDSPVTAGNAARALAGYLRTLLAGDAHADRFAAGDRGALSPLAEEGFQLFNGRANCAACHAGPTFSDAEFHNTGVSWGTGDPGRFRVTGDSADFGAFKTPTLRDVARTAPYMHDGSLATLEEVMEFYDRGGTENPYQDPEIRPLDLTDRQRRALVAFLRALTSSETPHGDLR